MILFLQAYWKQVGIFVLFLIWSVFLAIFFNNRGKTEAEIKMSQYEAKDAEYQVTIDSLQLELKWWKDNTKTREDKDTVLKNRQNKVITIIKEIPKKYETQHYIINNSPFAIIARDVSDRFHN